MTNRKKRVGIFGGSFNPPHLGHLLAAVYALKMFELDEIWFTPAYQHAFKKHLAPFSQRYRMLKQLIQGFTSKCRISNIEARIKNDGKMLHTIVALKKRWPRYRFFLVIGSDLTTETKRWYRFSEIQNKFGVLTVPRMKSKSRRIAIPNISSTKIRQLGTR